RRVWPQGYTYSLLLSERLDVGDATAALEAGFDDFLAAPIVFGELLARLRAGARFIEYERRLAEQSGLDVLTGLADKAALTSGLTEVSAGEALEVVEARVQRALALAKSSGRNCVVTSGEVDRDADAWAAFAAEGKLFETTLARDVMHLCPLLLHLDETLDHALA